LYAARSACAPVQPGPGSLRPRCPQRSQPGHRRLKGANCGKWMHLLAKIGGIANVNRNAYARLQRSAPAI
jgi:hypothetical protein